MEKSDLPQDVSIEMIREIASLIGKQSSWKAGSPFADQDGGRFGVDLQSVGGSMYTVSHVISHLEKAGFFSGERVPETRGDGLFYQFRLGEVKIYDNAVLDVQKEQTRLVLTSEQGPEHGLACLKRANESAQVELDRRRAQELAEKEAIRQRAAEDDADPVFDGNTDADLVKTYIDSIAQEFVKSGDFLAARVTPAMDAEGNIVQASSFSFAKTDIRPNYKITLTYGKESYSGFNECCWRLVNVFDSSSVDHRFPKLGPGVATEMRVSGNPSRLLRDIIKNDSEVAQQFALARGLSIPQELAAAQLPAPQENSTLDHDNI